MATFFKEDAVKEPEYEDVYVGEIKFTITGLSLEEIQSLIRTVIDHAGDPKIKTSIEIDTGFKRPKVVPI